MKNNKSYQRFILIICFLIGGQLLQAQTAWFADGYHGGVYGHYPLWQAKFMVDKLTENPTWKINLEIEPETWDTVSITDAENFHALQDYYSNIGRFGRIEFVNPAYAQPYCYNVSGESIIRQFSYGMAKIQQYFPDATFQTYSCEEPCFTSCLPEILMGFGYKFAVLRNPNTCWGGYTSSFGKDLVNWIGPDGTSIQAVPRYACEGLSSKSTWQTDSWTNSNAFITACFDDGIKYPVGMTFQDAGWKGGPWGNQYQPTVYTTWTDYINMIKDKVEPTDWEFSQEDIKPGLVWGAQVLQKLAQEVRVSENQMIMAEKMASLDQLFFGSIWPEKEFAEAWRTLMLAQHHDCWIVPYNGKSGNTWADKVTRWTGASNQFANQTINQVFGQLDSSALTIRVFNTLGYQRTDWVAVLLPEGMDSKDISIVNSVGKRAESQIADEPEGKKMLYFEAKVPALGYATYRLENKPIIAKPVEIETLANGLVKVETNFYTVIFNPEKGGTITSLTAKKQGNIQLVEEGGGLNDLRGFFYDEAKFHAGSDSKAKISVVENGELFIRLKIENQLARSKYTQLITLAQNNPRIDFELNIDWNGQPGIGAYNQSKNYRAEDTAKAFYNDNYKLHLEFPLKNVGQRIFKNAPFDVCESQLQNTIYTSWDSIKHNVVLNWVDVENASSDHGVALFSDHTTSYVNTKDLTLGLTVQYIGKALWGRDYRVDGPTHIKYALLPHSGNWELAKLEAESKSWNEPLIGRLIDSEAQRETKSLLEVSDKNLEVSSLVMQGNDLFVRFFNVSAENKKQVVYWNCSAEKMEIVDLNGKLISAITPEKDKDNRLKTSLNMPQFGLQTIKLTHVKAN